MYNEALAGIPGLHLPVEPAWSKHVYWMYSVTVDQGEFGADRDGLAAILAAQGIETRTFFCPMNMQPALQRVEGYRAVECPVAERLWERGAYLPSSPSLDSIRPSCDKARLPT